MSECEFVYGEKIEVKNDERDLWEGGRIFLTYLPEHPFPYFVTKNPKQSLATCWRYARRPLPAIKPGQPIMVRNSVSEIWSLGWFKGFQRDIEGLTVVKTFGNVPWRMWAKLEGYDYTQKPPVEVE